MSELVTLLNLWARTHFYCNILGDYEHLSISSQRMVICIWWLCDILTCEHVYGHAEVIKWANWVLETYAVNLVSQMIPKCQWVLSKKCMVWAIPICGVACCGWNILLPRRGWAHVLYRHCRFSCSLQTSGCQSNVSLSCVLLAADSSCFAGPASRGEGRAGSAGSGPWISPVSALVCYFVYSTFLLDTFKTPHTQLASLESEHIKQPPVCC